MSRIEQIITEIEDYIDSCKFQPLSNTKILVNKEEIEELLVELRLRIPEEIKKYQKIISNQDAILQEARSQADAMVAEATAQTNELVNEHEIMQRAYAEANSIIEQANAQAQQIVDNAVTEANNIRQGSVQYTDDMLRSLQTIIKHSMEGAQSRFESYMSSMQSSYDVVSSNRNELAGSVVAPRQQRPLHRRHPAKQQNKENERETGVNQFPQYIMPDGKSGIFFSVFSAVPYD